jgi:hypothetical protein
MGHIEILKLAYSLRNYLVVIPQAWCSIMTRDLENKTSGKWARLTNQNYTSKLWSMVLVVKVELE